MTNNRRDKRNMLQRVYRFWARRVPLPFDVANAVCAALQNHYGPKKVRLPAQCATPRAVTLLCLPRNLQEEILRLLPTKDR